jgi:predicted amidophosphoribosyltransferase
MGNNIQQQAEQQTQNAQQQATKPVEQQVHKCSNCGAAILPNDKFCPECGVGLKGSSCNHCGAVTKPDWEICPSCGHNLAAELCSFCGAGMTENDSFCPECGNPRTGIICPQCQTLNFRSFCRKCNAPLNAQALQALEEAKADPKFQQALAIAEELAELEEFIMSQQEEDAAPPEIPELSDENKELVNQYKDLLAAFRNQKPEEIKKEQPDEKPEPPKPESKPKTSFSINIVSKEDAIKKYKEKLADMQAALDAMIPDPDMTPQMQRNYYSARKVEVTIKTKGKMELHWICNAYGCIHYDPNDCAEPWKGGRWVYEEREEIKTIWVNQ